MFPYTDSATEESVPRENFDAYQTLKYETVYEQITKASPDVKTFEIKPSHCDMKQDICIHIKDLEGLCNSIKTLCRNNEEKYILNNFNNNKLDFPENSTLVSLFKNIVKTNGDKIAIETDNDSITYN